MSNRFDAAGEWPLQRLMTEVVGSGHRSAEDMTRSQAREAFQRILAGEPAPTTLGAFWLANRWKGNTPTELAAFADVMAAESVERAVPDADPVDCGANYDGKHTSALLGVASGLVAAATGTPVVVHSGDRVPTQEATAYKHVLDELGVRTDLDPAESAAMVDAVGFGFYYQPAFNPGVHGLGPRRGEMGVRTFLNTVETLANPAGAAVHLGSFYHLAFAKRVVDAVRAQETDTFDRVCMFQGLEGYDDVRPGSTVVAEWPPRGTHAIGAEDGAGGEGDTGDDSADDDIADFEIQTAAYGLDVDREVLAVDDVAADSAAITEAVIAGERDDAFADAVALNAALRLYAREDVADLATGVERAEGAIVDGRAAERLAVLRDF
jgi:anthranilate phosphoribosyltransferase